MKFYSISNREKRVSLKEAILRSVVNVTDLYMPVSIPVMPDTFIKNLKGRALNEIASEITNAVFGDDIPPDIICRIINEAFTFEIPLKRLNDNLYVLELFHGPTLAFKDVGARFMAGLFEFITSEEDHEINVLAATSGDTGSAVASAFYNKSGIRVIILYPEGKVSLIQEKQLTTMGGNIISIAVDGTFDDCQRLVKLAFADRDLNKRLILTSANSINFARLFPQAFYYFHAYAQLEDDSGSLVFSVPSGNFGNLTAGLIAKRMGLPVSMFIASTNINRSVPDYLNNGVFEPKPTQHTITNAMDVGNPGNFPRILELYNYDIERLRSDLKGYWFNDLNTMKAMADLMDEYSYQADPHGAVAYLGLSEFMRNNDCTGIFLETAHPVKFADVVSRATGIDIAFPAAISGLMDLEGKTIKMGNSFKELKEYLFSSG